MDRAKKELQDATIQHMLFALPCVITGLAVDDRNKSTLLELNGTNFRPNSVNVLNEIASKLISQGRGAERITIRLFTNIDAEIRFDIGVKDFLVSAIRTKPLL